MFQKLNHHAKFDFLFYFYLMFLNNNSFYLKINFTTKLLQFLKQYLFKNLTSIKEIFLCFVFYWQTCTLIKKKPTPPFMCLSGDCLSFGKYYFCINFLVFFVFLRIDFKILQNEKNYKVNIKYEFCHFKTSARTGTYIYIRIFFRYFFF